MTLPTPFAHPVAPHQRLHGPCGYDRYQAYKPWLRDEFTFRCVYCLERETWYPNRAASFSVDHVIPRSEDVALECEYTNLVYACNRCNSARSAARVVSPDQVGIGMHLRLVDDGLFRALTSDGQKLLDLLRLNEYPALSVRRKMLTLLELKATNSHDDRVHRLYLLAFGYPDDMPDLRLLRPPGGNRLTASEHTCHFAQREKGSLADVY